jgi:hypothetical protein
MKLNNTHKKLIANIVEDCNKYKVTVIFSNEKRVKLPEEDDSAASNGFFCGEYKILSVAAGNPVKQWFSVLLHEYNHFQQWKEDKFHSDEDEMYCQLFWAWLIDNEYLSKTKLNKVIFRQRNCEYDCEKRTIEILKKYPRIGIDTEYYTKRANSYLYFYTMVKKRRKWYVKAPYEIKEIIDIMPNKLLKNYNKVPKEYQRLVDKYCFG